MKPVGSKANQAVSYNIGRSKTHSNNQLNSTAWNKIIAHDQLKKTNWANHSNINKYIEKQKYIHYNKQRETGPIEKLANIPYINH